jgi:hypothetical protein
MATPLNIKQAYIDTDRAVTQINATTKNIVNQYLVSGTEYIWRANCYSNTSSGSFVSYSNTDTWSLYIGDLYGTAAAPVISITDQSKWNNTTSWSYANVEAGQIVVRINTLSETLTQDLGNNSSKTYTMEIWNNNVSKDVLICSCNCVINNTPWL